jgi:hypothetical protein
MAEQKPAWWRRWQERRRAKRARRGDSPEKRAERHAPAPDSIDVMLKAGGVDRDSRFTKD